MLIVPAGAACAGCSTLASYLVEEEGFLPLSLLRSPVSEARPSAGSANTGEPERVFSSPDALLDHVTAHWDTNFVWTKSWDVLLGLPSNTDRSSGTPRPGPDPEPQSDPHPAARTELSSFDELDAHTQAAFRKRPFFLLVAVQAPVGARYARSVQLARGGKRLSLERFVLADDERMYADAAAVVPRWGPVRPDGDGEAVVQTQTSVWAEDTRAAAAGPSLYALLSSADVTLLNAGRTPSEFRSVCAGAKLASPHRLRPPWDSYFLSLCTLAAARSNCMKRRVGCVLVRDKRVLATGYNGTPRGVRNCAEGGCARCNGSARMGASLTECLCLHAEENALLECGREKGGAQDTVLYCNTCPCLLCTVKIIQVGVKEVVYEQAYGMDGRSAALFKEAGIPFRQCKLQV